MDEAFWQQFIEQLKRVERAAKEARMAKTDLPPIECAFCGHAHREYGQTHGHVRYKCPQCGNAFMQ
jgi:transposase-like protein